MSSHADSIAAPVPGAFAAWTGGAVAALAAASLTLLLHGSPLGNRLWQHLPTVPAESVAGPLAFSVALLVGCGAAWVGATVQPMRRVIGLLGAAALLALSQSLVLALHGIAWEPLPTLLSLAGAGSIAALLRPGQAGLAMWFQGRVSPRTLASLTAAESLGFLRPDQREATVITCRLLNENALREFLSARDFLKLCEAFRARAASVLLEHGACLDPTESSGVRAFFGLPLPNPDAADQAVAAALALDDAMREFPPVPSSNQKALVCGIGLATGQLTAGLVNQTYTVLGDAVELSRWLAAQTTSYEVRLLTDAATHFAATRVEDRPLEFVNPPEGAAVEIFHLLGTPGSLSPEALSRRQAFHDAIMLLRAGHAGDALRRFADAGDGLTVPDPVLAYFISLASDQSQRDAAGHAGASPAGPALPSPQLPMAPPASPPPANTPRRMGMAGRKLPRRP